MITAILHDDPYHFSLSSKHFILNTSNMSGDTMLS